MKRRYDIDPESADVSARVEGMLAEALTPIAPAQSAPMRERLLARAQRSNATLAAATLVRREQGGWQKMVNGVHAKVLHEGRNGRALLVSFAAGTRMPAHRHSEDEECIVLDGSLLLGDLRVQRGDFHVAPDGSRHEPITAETDALIYLRGTPLGNTFGAVRDYLGGFLPGGKPVHTVRRDEGDWQAVAPGIERKTLWQRDATQSALLRLAPGAVLPAGLLHQREAECLLLEGEGFLGDVLLRDGDFFHGHAATTPLHSDVGALLYLRGPVLPAMHA